MARPRRRATGSSSTGSFHCSDAAPSSDARASQRPGGRTSQASATLDEPPVALMPSSRATLPTIQRLALTRPQPVFSLQLLGMEGQPGHEHRDIAVDPVGARLLDAAPRTSGTSSSSAASMRQRRVHALPHLAARHRQHARGRRAAILIQPFKADRRPSPGPCSRAEPRRERGGSTAQPTSSAPRAGDAGQQQGAAPHRCVPSRAAARA